MGSSNEIRIVIGGDTVPIGRGLPEFLAGAAEELVGVDLLRVIYGADFSVFNLEAPLVNSLSPIPKCGPNLAAPVESALGLAAVNPHAFALANNHILDHGPEGLASTAAALDAAGAPWFGAGGSLREASAPLVFEKGGVSVGFYACAEHEFTIAGDGSPGANPFDALESFDHVAALKAACDCVVVLYHGGKEHYRYPSPQLRRVCRKFAEKGADLVVCQHSHCVGCRESWRGSELVYGQGNFLFDHGDSEFWQTGLLLSVAVSGAGLRVEYIPIRKRGGGVRLAKGGEAEDILAGFEERSNQIGEPDFLEYRYAEFAEKALGGYLAAFTPGGRTLLFRAANKLSGHQLARRLTSKARLLSQRNCLECEAHRELFLEGLKGRRV